MRKSRRRKKRLETSSSTAAHILLFLLIFHSSSLGQGPHQPSRYRCSPKTRNENPFNAKICGMISPQFRRFRCRCQSEGI
ncbi:hypothetical protein B0T09DRAFT_64469 [Sordaria sp. MPI-SDFR-AT-0083]|nr:hypothetical protein B0T09DRAFT_64469 [Sordaria sp. MPI-SDFR-AT-0083]